MHLIVSAGLYSPSFCRSEDLGMRPNTGNAYHTPPPLPRGYLLIRSLHLNIAFKASAALPEYMGSLTKCVPGSTKDLWIRAKKIDYYTLFDLWAYGCLQSLKRLQKWKVQAICDRSYAAWFSQSHPGSKVMADRTSKSDGGNFGSGCILT